MAKKVIKKIIYIVTEASKDHADFFENIWCVKFNNFFVPNSSSKIDD
jgi:hypothetical protein